MDDRDKERIPTALDHLKGRVTSHDNHTGRGCGRKGRRVVRFHRRMYIHWLV